MAFEVVEAIEVAEASEVNESAGVLRPEKSLLRTSVIKILEFSFILMFLRILFLYIIMKYDIEY
jgi:hypothetical protein